MAGKPAPTKAHEPEPSAADEAFGVAAEFVQALGTLANHARWYRSHPDKPDAWKDAGANYAMAFVAWFDLSHLLTPTVRSQARLVYPPGPGIRLGKLRPQPSVIEAVADELGICFRNMVYADRRHPLEPDTERVANEAKARATARQVSNGRPAEPLGWGADYHELMKLETRAAVQERLGIKTRGDALLLMVAEWQKQDREKGELALSLLRCESIDFDELRVQLIREYEAVMAAASKPNAPAIDPAQLARLEAAVVGLPAVLEGNRAGFERVASVIESLGARDDDDGDTKPPALPAVAEAIDEHDEALLAFLNRSPSLRRKVSDVIPATGPQDRKAVAKRLRKLADRTPPLVDYPKGGRSGVVILPTGAEALKRATAPTPR